MNATKSITLCITILLSSLLSWGCSGSEKQEAAKNSDSESKESKESDDRENLTNTPKELHAKFSKLNPRNRSELKSQTNILLAIIRHDDQQASLLFYLKLWNHPDELVRNLGKEQLARHRNQVAPLLVGYSELKSTDDYNLMCEALRTIGPLGNEHLEKLAEYSRQKSQYQMAFMFALSAMGEKAKPYMEDIRKCTQNTDMNTRLWACRVVRNMGKDGAAAAPDMIRLLKEGTISDKGLASLALGAIGLSEDYDLLELLGKQLKAFTQPEKERALDAVAMLGPAAISLKEDVAALMRNRRKSCVPAAAWCYYKLTGDSQEPIEATIKILKEDLSYGGDAARRLGRYGADAGPAIPALIEQLGHAEPSIREEVVLALSALGATAQPAVKKLEEIAKSDTDSVIRFEAAKAAKSIQAAVKQKSTR